MTMDSGLVFCVCGDDVEDHSMVGNRKCLEWGCRCEQFVEDDDA